MRLHVNNYLRILEEKGLSNEDVCKTTGLSMKRLKWILENSGIKLNTFEVIAETLGCSTKEISLMDGTNCNENVIEFTKDQQEATVTFSQGRYITRIKKLAVERPKECRIVVENVDGSIIAHIPTRWIRINPSLELTEEQRQKKSECMKHMRRKQKSF